MRMQMLVIKATCFIGIGVLLAAAGLSWEKDTTIVLCLLFLVGMACVVSRAQGFLDGFIEGRKKPG